MSKCRVFMILKSNFWYWTLFRPYHWAWSSGTPTPGQQAGEAQSGDEFRECGSPHGGPPLDRHCDNCSGR